MIQNQAADADDLTKLATLAYNLHCKTYVVMVHLMTGKHESAIEDLEAMSEDHEALGAMVRRLNGF